MTKINKLVIGGFKSFATKVELPFGNGFNCVLGPNGSGKCVTADTQVQLANGTLISIGELYHEKEASGARQLDDGFIVDGDGTSVFSLNLKTLHIESRPIQAYIKRRGPDKLLEVTTRSGRTIKATPYHPLFVFRDNNVVAVRADELKEGVRIAVPRHISAEPETRVFVELLDLITVRDGLYVPWSAEVDVIVRSQKTRGWGEMALRSGVPLAAIKGLLDKQSINFAHLVRLLRSFWLPSADIIGLIPRIKGKTGSKTYPMLWRNSPEFARFLGYLLAEGYIADVSNQIWMTNGTEEVVQDYIRLAVHIFGEQVSVNEYKPGVWDAIIYSSPIKVLISKFGMPLSGGTERKYLSNFFFTHSGSKELAGILNGLYSGDGYVSDRQIEITTKSRTLCLAIQTALTRLGVLYQTKDVIKICTTSGFSGSYKSIRIYGRGNFVAFASHVQLIHPMKRQRTAKLLVGNSNPNLDLIEVNDLVGRVSHKLGINVKQARKLYPQLDAYCYNQCTPSRMGVNELVQDLFLPRGEGVQELVQLQQIAEANIYFDEIVSIQEIPSEEWVYDLCVAEHHNFIANNIFVHNSNVLDAICFVLGRMGSKSLRAEKSANLIYNGGKKKRPAEKGEVHIYFDNGRGVFPVDTPEVKVTRIIKKNGQSVYKINDKTRTRNEVVDLLGAARINPEGYNIILQGDITRFVEMSPLERRQIVEELSGISVYEEKKHKALLELEKVEKKLNDAEIVLNERKTHLRELKKDRDQAMKFKELKDNIDSNKATYVHLQVEKKAAEKGKLEKEVNGLQEKLSKAEGRLNELKQEMEKRKEQIEKITSDIERKGEVEQVKLSKDVENLRVNLEKQKARVGMIKDALVKIKQRKTALDKDVGEIDKNISELQERRKELEKQKAGRESELGDVEKKIEHFKKRNKIDALGDVDKEIEAVDKAIEKKQEEIQKVRLQQQELLREKDKLEFQIQSLDQQIRKVSEVERANKKEIDTLKAKKERFKQATLELNTCLDMDSKLARQLADVRQEVQSLHEEKAKLEGRQASAQERVGGDLAVRKILELKKKRSGIYGTIAELGRVDKKYSLALEIAAGARLMNIIVEDDKTAADCIKYLKDNKFGVATFIPLNKIKAPEVRGDTKTVLKEKGAHDLCVNLVKFDTEFTKAFEYVFGDTVVVDTLDVARRIGIGKARMVTLEGDLADYSGVMRGGHYVKRVGAFVESDVMKDIGNLEKSIGELSVQSTKLAMSKDANEKRILELRQEKVALEGDVARAEKLLHLGAEDLDATKSSKSGMQEQLKAVEKKLEEISATISTINHELADIKSKKERLKVQVSQLRNPQLLAEMGAFEEARQKAKELLLQTKGEIDTLDVQIKNMMLPEKERIRELIKGHDKEEYQFTQEMKELDAKIKEGDEELTQKEKVLRAFFSAYKDLFHQRDKLHAEVKELENRIEEVREQGRKVEIEMNTLSLQLAAIKSELAGLETQFAQFKGAKLISGKSEEELKAEIGRFEHMLANMSAVNMKALEIYEQVEVEYNKLVEQRGTLVQEKQDVVVLMEEIEGKKKDQFLMTLKELDKNFQQKFNLLSKKGDAYLQLENPEKPFEGGLNIRVRLLGQRYLDIKGLSGGEKTLTALAFIFSIQEHQPHSFYIMDEVDAALDKHNSEKLAQLVRQYCAKAQYVVVSHNDALISEADTLYGVSMNEHGESKVVSLKV